MHSASLCSEKLFGIHIFRGQVLSFSTTTIWQVFYIKDLTRFVINDFTNFWPVCAQCKFCPSGFVWKIIWHPLFFEVKFLVPESFLKCPCPNSASVYTFFVLLIETGKQNLKPVPLFVFSVWKKKRQKIIIVILSSYLVSPHFILFFTVV